MLRNIYDYVIILKSGLFDRKYYLKAYPEVRQADVDPLWHFICDGWKEGRNPSDQFDTKYYLENNWDVQQANLNPLIHYIKFGKAEGRLENNNREFPPYTLAGREYKNDEGQITRKINLRSSRDSIQANYLSYNETLVRMLLTKQQIDTPYNDREMFVIGTMESFRVSLANKYIQLPQDELVSIIVPTYNRANIIGDAIDSVFTQKYKNWELIVVDDNGSDNTEEVVNSYNDPRIRYLRNDINVGCGGSRNVGLQYAKGNYIGYLDSDNTLVEDFLLIMVNELSNHSNIDVIYCAQRLIFQKENKTEEKGIRFAPFHRPTLENHNYIDAGTIFHRRSIIEQGIKFNQNIRTWEDWHFLICATENKPAYGVPCILSNYFFNKTDDQLIAVEKTPPALKEIDSVLRTRDGMVNIPNPIIDTDSLYSSKTVVQDVPKLPVSIVIPSYNCLDYLKLCLASIEKFSADIDYEVIVVDNASNSKVVRYLEDFVGKDRYQVIFNKDNLGFTSAVNQGILAAKTQNDVILLNNDTVVTRNWINAFQEVKFNYPDVGLIMPAQIVPANEKTLLIHRPLSNPNREMDVNISMHHGNLLDPVFDAENGYMELSFAPFFCVYFPRDTIKVAGLLDEVLGVHYYSDHFYSIYLREILRRKIIYTPKSKVYHFVQRATSTLVSKDKDTYMKMLECKW